MADLKLDRIVDTTLREGEQTPTVYFKPEEKCLIAEMLRETLGSKASLEIGQPYSPKYREGVEAVVNHFKEKGYGDAKLLSHSRTLKEDIDIARRCDTWGVVMVLAPTEKHLLHKMNRMTFNQALKQISDSIRYAKDKVGFPCVQYTVEDATSLPPEKLLEVARVAVEAGVDVLRIPDTKGQVEPEGFESFIRRLVEGVDVPVDVHCHNDRGLATANAIAGLRGGATGVHVSVLGLGERCGITDLATFVEDLETFYGVETQVDFKKIPSLYQHVAALSGIPIPPTHPILGAFARVHKAGEHQKSVIRCPETYETIDWDKYGLRREYEFGAMQSKELIANLLGKRQVPTEKRRRIMERIRALSMAKARSLRLPEVYRIIEEEAGFEVASALGVGEERMDAILFVKVRPSCDELELMRGIRKKFLDHNVAIKIRDIAGDWDFIIDAKGIQNPALLDEITRQIRRENHDIVETSTSIVFDEYK